MAAFDYVRPISLKALVDELAQVKSKGAVLAGGTDILVKIRSGVLSPKVLFDANHLLELNGISDDGDRIRIGALTRIAEILGSNVIKRSIPFLSSAASHLGSPQIRNRATVGGNVLTASPAADMVPPLLAMGAQVRLRGQEGERFVTIEDFMVGPGRTSIRNDEILVEIIVPRLEEGCRSHFLKVGRRRALAISVVNVAGWLKANARGEIEEARIVLGAVAPTATRAKGAEMFLRGKRCTAEVIGEAARLAAGESRPITDIRGTDRGRRLLVEAWTGRMLHLLTSSQGKE